MVASVGGGGSMDGSISEWGLKVIGLFLWSFRLRITVKKIMENLISLKIVKGKENGKGAQRS